MSGVELVPKALAADSDLAIIMLTAIDEPRTAIECLKLGAYDYLIKPVDLDELEMSLQSGLRQRQLEIDRRELEQWLAREVAVRTRDLEERTTVVEDIAVADTQCGTVRGYVLRGIHHYLGIPYGADTSGANRFMPPQKPKSWTGVRPALWWGNSAPQNMDNRYASAFPSFRDHWNYDDVSKDCLRLNVFTPAVKDGKKLEPPEAFAIVMRREFR